MDFFKKAKEELIVLRKASDSYYNQDESMISDSEFDQKKDYLVSLYEKYLLPKKSLNQDFVKEVEDFLNQIGAPVTASKWKKAKHKIPMTSLNKVNSEEEFRKWENEIGDKEYILFDKMDGGSIELIYKNSKLVQAITRGDGSEGEQIVQNVQKMKNVKIFIEGFSGSLRGEIVILRDDFEALNTTSDREYKNPRNTATGLSKNLEGINVEFLSILFYDIDDDNKFFKTEEEKLLYIESLGLKTCFWKKVTVEELIKIFKDYEINVRVNLPYDIDGMVIRANSIELQEKCGELGGNPKAKIAWKFAPMKKDVKLLDVIWNLSNRRITPIALLEPTNMGGVVVSRCTLNNVDIFKEFGIKKNCIVELIRANDVIPKILSLKGEGNVEILIPSECPICGEHTQIDGKFLYCSNEFCSGLGNGNLKRWVNTLEIESIGPEIIKMLYEKDLVREPADFYKLTVEQLSGLDRLGERSANKIVNNFKAKMELTLPEFISGLNIPSFSIKTSEALLNAGYNTIDKILNAKKEDLVKIKGIELKTATFIIEGMKSKVTVIQNLLEVGIKIREPIKISLESEKFKGISFCFTGAIQSIKTDGKRYTREDMYDLVLKNGGKIEESVKRGLSFLVMADPNSTSSKANKAREIGTKIMSEEEFFRLINN